jgi:glycosyltransferase involved in cell wall biosynthesis
MRRFARLLNDGLAAVGVDVTLLEPTAILGRGFDSRRGLGKWLGYLDKFVLFPRRLRREIRGASGAPFLVHVCDQGNAHYVRWLRDVPHVVTCHDVLAIRAARDEFAGVRTRWSGKRLQSMVLRGLRESQRIVCDSRATAGDLVRIGHVPAGNLDLVHPGLSPAFTPMNPEDARARVKRLALPAPFLLHVGADHWYKNRGGLLKIYAELVQRMPSAPPLVVAGAPLAPWEWARVAGRRLSGRVIEVSGLDDADLAALYSCATLLLFPSLAEGYGWPVLEAMACGCRVVTSRRAPLTEIAGEAATYIDPIDPAAAADIVAGVLQESAARRQSFVAAGIERSRVFTPAAMVDAYLRIYRREIERAADLGAAQGNN